MQSDPFLALVGITRKAGKFAYGYDTVCQCVADNAAPAVFVTSDFSPSNVRRVYQRCVKVGIKLYQVVFTMEQVSDAVGIKTGVFVLCDEGITKKALTYISAIGEELSYDNQI